MEGWRLVLKRSSFLEYFEEGFLAGDGKEAGRRKEVVGGGRDDGGVRWRVCWIVAGKDEGGVGRDENLRDERLLKDERLRLLRRRSILVVGYFGYCYCQR